MEDALAGQGLAERGRHNGCPIRIKASLRVCPRSKKPGQGIGVRDVLMNAGLENGGAERRCAGLRAIMAYGG